MTSSDKERQELERVVELLGRTTRPARLLAFIGAKYFLQQQDQLTEFSIATDVFGRSPKTFDSTEDAVVRVEAHRLRKKLREIYEKSDSPFGLHISLPGGSYVPIFLAASDPRPADDAAQPHEHREQTQDGGARADVEAHSASGRTWKIALAAVVGLGCVAIISVLATRAGNHVQTTTSVSQASPAVPSTAAVSGKVSELHILAGYGGSEVIDNSGVKWTPDQFFSGGSEWPRDGYYVRGTSRQFLFGSSRSGQFEYDIPVERGTYELRMFFLSPFRAGDEKIASFNVVLNGQPLLTAYDVNLSVGGPDIADEKVFRDITPAADGFIRLGFVNAVGTPGVNAIELTAGEPGKQKAIRITTQATSYVDHQGRRWRADDYYLNGFRSVERAKVVGTDDPELFSAERYGHFTYAIPVDVRGSYTVVLHFAELYFGPQLQGGGGVGSRVFHVFCNGQTLLRDFDIFREAGSRRVVTKTFPNIRASALGKINLTFEPVVNNATISAIEILDESH